MAGPPDQEPKPAGCGCRWLWDIVVFLVLVFLLWLERDNIPSAISDLRSTTTWIISGVRSESAPLIDTVVVNTAPIAVTPRTPRAATTPSPGVIALLTPTAAPAQKVTVAASPTQTIPSLVPTMTTSPTPTATPSMVPSETRSPTPTNTPSEVSTATASPTPTATPSLVPTATASPTPTIVSPLAPAAINSLTPRATVAIAPAVTITATPTSSAPTTSFLLSDFENGPWLEQEDPNLASAVEELRWLQDGIYDLESRAIEDILYIAVESLPLASSVVSLGWVQDGIDDPEALAIEGILFLALDDSDLGSAVVTLSWVQDGIDGTESWAIEAWSYIAYEDPAIAASFASLDWVRDGIDGPEAYLIRYFAYLAREDANAAARVLRMPFLRTIEPADLSAVESLTRLAIFERETFYSVLSHPVVSDGISDRLSPIVATLYGVAETNPALIDVLLDPNNVVLEPRTVELPLSGEVVLYIIRTGPGAARSMDLLEHAVRNAEALMGIPLPINYVGMLFEDAVPGSSGGTNFGTHIAFRPEYDIDDGSAEAELAGRAIAHEVAHYYWSGNADWIDEGAADFMAAIIEGGQNGRALGVSRPPCAYVGNIAELESLEVKRGDLEVECNYSLGERLFSDLYRTLGAERFRQGFRELYQASTVEDDIDDRGTSLGIGHVKTAFRTSDGAADIVIARWYDGTEPYDLSDVDRSQVDPRLPAINGRIEEAYLTTGDYGPRVSRFSANGLGDWMILNIEYSYSVSGAPHQVPVEIVEYYQDGFAYFRESGTLTAEEGYAGGTMWFTVGREPTERWAPGHYAVFVYAGGRKVAEVYYEVIP